MTKKTRVLKIRVTEDEANAFQQYANRLNIPKASLLKKLIRELINQAPEFTTDEQSLLLIAIRQLVGMTHNITQVITAIQRGQYCPSVDLSYLHALKSEIMMVKQALASHIERTRIRWVKPVDEIKALEGRR